MNNTRTAILRKTINAQNSSRMQKEGCLRKCSSDGYVADALSGMAQEATIFQDDIN
jgi:hypothetical protein